MEFSEATENVTVVIWRMLLIAETKVRRLKAPELIKKVYLGAQYHEGLEVTPSEAGVCPRLDTC